MRKNLNSKTPTPEELKLSTKDMFKAVFFLLEDQKKKYIFYSIFLIAIFFYDLVPAFLVGKIVDFFTNYTSNTSLTPFYFYSIFLGVTWGFVSLVRLTLKKQLTNIQSETIYRTRVKGFERLLDFSLKWHDEENTGNKVQKVQQGADSLRSLQKLLSGDIFPQLTTILGVLIAFFLLHQSFFWFGFVYLVVFLSIQAFFYKKILKLNYAHNASLEKASGSYYEGLSNVLTIKTLGVKDDFKKNIGGREEMSRDFALERVAVSNIKWKLFQTLNALAIVTVLVLAGNNFLAGVISLGSLFVAYTYFQKLSGATADSTQVIDDFIACKVGISRMMPIFWGHTYNKFEGTLNFPSAWETISVTKGSFNYKKTEEGNVSGGITNLTVTIRKHEKIGVVGKSGSGKSTFAKVLLGLYELDSGEYKLDTKDFYKIKHSEITDNMALVLQDSEMFNLSLKENITLMRKFNNELFERAIDISELKEIIEKMPDGADTLIGEKGYRLSGGERQRIGIARAIYKDPQILIFDEATSSLDSKTEKNILNAIEEKLKQKTIISIAHRISTLENSDRIFVFDSGKIVEEGGFQELSKKQESKFFEVYKSQKVAEN